jgi:hypothetical protein
VARAGFGRAKRGPLGLSVLSGRRASSPSGEKGAGAGMTAFTESVVEDAALGWLEGLGYAVVHGPEIAPGEPGAEREDYGQVVLEERLRRALTRLNPALPAEGLEDAPRKLTRPDGPTMVARNHAVHRLLVEGVTVEYRRPDGSIAGAQARFLDYDHQEGNEWLAVNQFTVTEGKGTARRAPTRRPHALPGRSANRRSCSKRLRFRAAPWREEAAA